MTELLETLRERGFIQQTTDDETADKPLAKLLGAKRITGYVGFDPTASSLHIGNLVPVMGLVHLQRAGHRPIAIVGGGTGLVGDPSGKTELRKLLGAAEIQANLEAQKTQLSRFLDLGDPPAPASRGQVPGPPASASGFLLNNADWLATINYIDFLREVGRHFSVNRMLAAESVKLRLAAEGGLSFLEFNYSLFQAYDFLVLNERYGCELQMGGADQWGNIVAGIDLIRRVTGRGAHGITFPLITTSDGRKMGKTVDGAVWLDASRTSPYEYYQYWINVDDRDVGRFLRMFTLLERDEIKTLEALPGAEIRRAKERLAFAATVLNHGVEAAEKAREASRSLFGGGGDSAQVPTHALAAALLKPGIPAFQLFHEAGLSSSRKDARRLADGGGMYVNGVAVSKDHVLTEQDVRDGAIQLRAGKKNHIKVVVR